ncbi:MAG: hypothetical protein HHJ15_13510 [Rhodoferax sp.]|uniref:hypothetical protein n=1 Tax=Rhodoferax sp. TaxID=50421 RepID=UPI0017CEB948|nr:hypothetical protein [Rhodoferax sp.]NMM20948.1 hypothetical protein [Rhodoferax sp.]
MADLKTFKRSLEQALRISRWLPTDSQLEKIRLRFVATPPKDVGEALRIVQSVYGPTSHLVLDGLDNSDLRTALALAIAAAKA